MLASLLIVFREVLEAGLIVGIVLAATQGVAGRAVWIAGGIAAGVLGATVLAVFAGTLSDAFGGNGQEIFNASILAAAVVMLGWHNIWMASHGREMAQQIKAVGVEVSAGNRPLFAVAFVVTAAVLREGAEIVLFLYGIAASGGGGWPMLLLGGALGIAGGGAVSWLLYRGLLAIPIGRLFQVTSWLIALLAAGMASQSVALLAKADIVPSWGFEIWDTSWLLDESSIVGRAMRALVGYSDRPMGIQLVAYLATLGALVIGARLVNASSARNTPNVSPVAE
ncbi:high-affinity iron transporter [Enhydrobacter aerosaccus]|uniref:High-affinity iron transporter n=1 Tax=Enhydrobacter aerosaccus TaxID=225324 RepID=A0A1T4SCK2_9HYPH|nr:FTR1 family protein [Enhydrobacter aerosaccus]SKA25628.1 high-affinity iron transporter [Enhydrobacter aerosaccus]